MLDKSSGMNNRFIRYLLQAVNYAIFIALIWYFSTAPAIKTIEDDKALLTIAFAHAGKTRGECRRLSQEELMKLPPNMRKPDDCPRERSPIIIEASLDGKSVFNKTFLPPGIYHDGSVDIYYRSEIPAGKHRLEIKMDDSVRDKGFDYRLVQDIDIKPMHIQLIEFEPLKGFYIK